MNTDSLEAGACDERGAAAIEFALVLPILVLLLWGLVTFGAAFYTQMAVSRAAEDAARSVPFLTTAKTYDTIPATVKTSVKNEAINSLANSLIVPNSSSASYASRLLWLQNNVFSQIIVDNGTCGGGIASPGTLRVSIGFPLSGVRILPSISLLPFGSFSSWMPDTLTGCAIAQL